MQLKTSLLVLLAISNAAEAGPVRRFLSSVIHSITHTPPSHQGLGAPLHRAGPSSSSNPTARCSNQCGGNCCSPTDVCAHDALSRAFCSRPADRSARRGGRPIHLEARQYAGGYYTTYTSTYVSTAVNLVTYTSTWSSWVASADATCSPDYAAGQVPCGSQCCNNGWYCQSSAVGLCATLGASFTNGGVGVGGGSGSVAVRPTTISGVVVTQTITPTFTTSFQPASSAAQTGSSGAQSSGGGGGSRLSGGAIAGIVIGTLFGIGLLFFICFCCCLRAGIQGILGLFGLGKKKRSSRHSRSSGSRTEEIIEEEYIRRHRGDRRSAAGSRRWPGSERGTMDSWDESNYTRPTRRGPPAKKAATQNAGWAGKLAALGAPAFLLGGKKATEDNKRDPRRDVYRNKRAMSERDRYPETEYTMSEDSFDSYDDGRPPPRAGDSRPQPPRSEYSERPPPPRSEYTRRSSRR